MFLCLAYSTRHVFEVCPCCSMYPFIHLVVLICIALLIDAVEHLFMYLLVICRSSLEKCVFKSLAHFKIGLLVFLLNCQWSFYILDIKPLPDTWIAHVLPFCGLSFRYLDNFLLMHKFKKYFLRKSYLPVFSFVACAFGIIPKNPFPNPSSWRCTLMLYTPLRVLWT